MRKKLLGLVILSALSTSGYAADADLMHIYQQALENDTLYKISESNLKATEQGVRISRSSLLPQISASASRTRSDFDSSGGQDGSPSDPFNSVSNSTRLAIQLNQSLFDWNQWLTLDQSEMRLRASELNHAASLQGLMLRTTQAYLNVLSAEESLAATQAEKGSLKKQLDLTQEQYQAGLAGATDYLNAQANYDQSVANEVSLQNSLTINQEALREVTGQYYVALEGLNDEIDLASPSPNNISDWVNSANSENLGLKAQQMNMRIARKEVKRNKSGHYPKLDFNLSYTDTDTDNDRTFPNGIPNQQFDNTLPVDPVTNPALIYNSSNTSLSDGYSAGITLTVPLFSGNRTSAQTEQARYNYQRSSHELEQQARLVQRNARNAFTGLQASIQSFEANKRAVESSASSLEATEEGYQIGTRNILDVLLATRSYYGAKRSLINAKYSYLINGIKLKEAAGTLSEADLEQLNRLLHQF